MTGKDFFQKGELEKFVAAIFHAAGMPADHAKTVADILVWAELRGVESHGLERIPRYLDLLSNGQMNATARPHIRDVAGAAFAIDSDRLCGLVAMTMATGEAQKRAGEFGVAMGLVANTTHTGAIGYYADHIARNGMAAICVAAGMPLMAYPGTRQASISTSPLAIGVPGGPTGAMVLDMSTAVASNGKLKKATLDKQPIPEGWALDSEGNPVTDASKASVSLPVGGPKGAGLSLMIEILASILGANPVTSKQALPGSKRVHTANGMIIVIDIEKFRPLDAFTGDIDELAAVIKSMPRFAGAEEVRMPGERGAGEYEKRTATGTPINARLRATLAARARELGVSPPQDF